MIDPTLRFTTRVENYIKYRPGYPDAVIEFLRDACALTPDWRVADVGSGTGILSELFLKNGNTVYGVEPNAAMLEAAEALLRGYPRFHSIAGRAEATELQDQSIDLVSAGQAFHWFDAAQARREFARILVPGGWAALIWNERRGGGTPFLEAYERMLHELAPEYAQVDHRHVNADVIGRFFAPAAFMEHTLANHQDFDYEGLRGRLLSSSYVPESGQPGHKAILRELRRIYDQHQVGGRVRFEYETKIFVGRISTTDGHR